jgi:hypothetical protein
MEPGTPWVVVDRLAPVIGSRRAASAQSRAGNVEPSPFVWTMRARISTELE